MIMGLGLGRWGWGRQVPALARHFRVITYDHRGTGESEAAPPGYGIGELAGDALGLLDALGVERAHLVGVSMGGFIAQTLAIEHPSRAGRLVLGATSFGWPGTAVGVARPDEHRDPDRPDPHRPDAALWRAFLGLREAPPAEAVATVVKVFLGPSFSGEHPRVAELFARGFLEHFAPAETLAAQGLACARFDESARVGRIRAPALVVHGTADALLPAANAARLSAVIPGAKLVLYEGAGHGFIIERAREFNRDVLAFLKRS
jgi:pimeloyl-ACP methyl ester carboxylesterase